MSRPSSTDSAPGAGATGESPSLFWRSLSATTIVGVTALCRSFLYLCSRPETHGLEEFLGLLDERKDPTLRKKGLLTVSNHISVMDDPLMWGFLPMKYNFGLSSANRRWGLASHDICYQTRPLALFFTMGQLLPTHRSAHSKFGGIAQPAVTQAIRLLSKGPFAPEPHLAVPERQSWSLQNVCIDPFSDLPTAYTTDGEDSHLAPSAFACNSYSWVHIFPEGKIHQSPNKVMRYFKWGVARLILETPECPDIVPLWLEGFDQVMHESREFPRFLPRPGKEISVTFGKKVDTEAVFGEARSRWNKLKAKAELASPEVRDLPVGALNDELLYGAEAMELRIEVTKKVRDLVLEVRRSRGHSDEDPKGSFAETWFEEGRKGEGKMQDESWPPHPHPSSHHLNHHLPSLPSSLSHAPMPKKHHKPTFAKPASTPHHSLSSSSLRSAQNDPFRPSAPAAASAEERSVNDLIHHLRRTQASPATGDGSRRIPQYITPRTVHPSLRNLLDIPETPPPRPRPDARRTGIVGRRVRRTAGPPPPASWLSGDTTGEETGEAQTDEFETGRVIYRLERLPGKEFPAERSMVHLLLKAMATQWAWHVAYDGQFLAVLPTHIKMLLLSYVGYYGREQALGGLMRGLKPLFDNTADPEGGEIEGVGESDVEVTHLDLSGAVGRWITLKQLSSELILPKKKGPAEDEPTNSVPLSWEDELEDKPDSSSSAIPRSLQPLRFQNLQYLSLAHPNPGTVSWNSLLHLLTRLSTITHLSLADWPVPTATPKALNARIKDPSRPSLSIAYSGTDSYANLENNWAESASILRRLSRATYCLKWLDLEGCGDWIKALNWQGEGLDGRMHPFGAEWNGSWRDIEYIRLGPGWLPHLDDSDVVLGSTPVLPSPATASTPRTLATSIHAPTPEPPSTDTLQTWDIDVERQKYRLAKELERFRESIQTAKAVQRGVLQTRKEGRGKWVNFSFGLEDVEEDLLERILGPELRREFF
ncbi:hypothetical protein BJY04DRAFT_230289 [Aspergillus karnatakaensis]|uniref:uncharacterized protein n=1 Tax=Aspergillus karnatakaensis TaxID=1810916 RepID=UPI003CCE10BD